MTLAERIERVLEAEVALSPLGRAELRDIATKLRTREAQSGTATATSGRSKVWLDRRAPHVAGPECEEIFP